MKRSDGAYYPRLSSNSNDMETKQLENTIEECKGVFRFTCKEKGITIYINLNVAGYNYSVAIRLPTEGCYCSLSGRVNDEEDIVRLLTKVKIIADTLRGNN